MAGGASSSRLRTVAIGGLHDVDIRAVCACWSEHSQAMPLAKMLAPLTLSPIYRQVIRRCGLQTHCIDVAVDELPNKRGVFSLCRATFTVAHALPLGRYHVIFTDS